MLQSDDEADAGIFFCPTDEELIKHYLKRKIKNKPCGDFIVHKDVYAKEPWLLDHYNKDNFFLENQWFYFVTRTQVSELKGDHGKNSKRKINGDNDDRGNWKVVGEKLDIKDEKTGKVIGIKQTLNFNKSDNNNNNNNNNNKKQKLGDNTSTSTCAPSGPGSESSWNMEEYTIVDGDNKFQKLVLCKIKKKKIKSNKKDEAIAAPEQSENDDQIHINPPLSYSSAGSSLQGQEGVQGDGGDWLQDYYFEPVVASSSQQQPINDVSGFIEAGHESAFIKDDQVHTNAPLGYYSSLLTQEANEEKGNIDEFYDQAHTNAPLGYYSSLLTQQGNEEKGNIDEFYDQVHTNPLQRQEGEGKDWMQDYYEPVAASSSQQEPINDVSGFIEVGDELEFIKDDQVRTNAPLDDYSSLLTRIANQGKGWIDDFASVLLRSTDEQALDYSSKMYSQKMDQDVFV